MLIPLPILATPPPNGAPWNRSAKKDWNIPYSRDLEEGSRRSLNSKIADRAVCCFTLGKTIRRKSKNDGQPTGAQPTQLETANGPE
jgi:hypothetical protein